MRMFEDAITEFKSKYTEEMIKDRERDAFENMCALQQELTFYETEQEFARRSVDFTETQKKSLKMINAEGAYTNLGLLFSDQCMHTIKLAVFEGATKVVFKDRREFQGSLLKQLRDTYEYIDRYNRLHAEIESLYRIEKKDYPEEALREVLLNALVHRDYSFRDSTLISIFDDRVEVASIGGLLRGLSYGDILLGISAARNPCLANVFYRLRLIEAYGTGMPRIMHSYEQERRKPKIQVSDHVFKITLPNRNADSVIVRESGATLSENEKAIMQLFEGQEKITRKEVETAVEGSQAMAVRLLKRLVERKLIRPVGGGKNTKYVKEEPSNYE